MKIDLVKIKKELKQRGFFSIIEKIKKEEPKAEIYLVGGAVRDLIIGRQTNDFDFVVRNLSAKKLEKILAKLGKVNFVGKTFGVFKVTLKKSFLETGSCRTKDFSDIDVALPRTDYAFGTGGRKDFKIKYDYRLPIEKDLSRRDFTINAMALQIKDYRLKITDLIDPFGGLQDLKKKTIKTVGKPEQRFEEDYSRILRAVRIACELNYKIEHKTWQAIKKNVRHLNKIRGENRVIPYEVIAKELLKALKANPEKAFCLFDQAGVFKILIPEIEKMKKCPQPKQFHAEGDVFQHTQLALDVLSSNKFAKEFSVKNKEKPSLNLIIATLLHDIGKPSTTKTPEKDGVDRVRSDNHDMVGAKMAEEIISRLKLTSPPDIGLETKKIFWLIKNHLIMLQMKNNLAEIKPSTLEKYFFNQEMPSQDLLKLIFADISACQPAKIWKPIFKEYAQLKKQLKKLSDVSKKERSLPPPILNGHQIMKVLKIKPSPLVGRIKDEVREAQLEKKIKNKKEAINFIQKKYEPRP